jgi:hypothetical protein
MSIEGDGQRPCAGFREKISQSEPGRTDRGHREIGDRKAGRQVLAAGYAHAVSPVFGQAQFASGFCDNCGSRTVSGKQFGHDGDLLRMDRGCRRSTDRSILIKLINMNEWIDRAEALALLGVKPQTLYAYVSRGRIEVRRETTGARRSLYRAEDVAQLARRAGASRKPALIAAESMAWGEASIVTHISTVQHGRLIYRGEDAASFSATASLENAARLLWNSEDEIDFPVPATRHANPFPALAGLVTQCQASIGRGRERLCRDPALPSPIWRPPLASHPALRHFIGGWRRSGRSIPAIPDG